VETLAQAEKHAKMGVVSVQQAPQIAEETASIRRQTDNTAEPVSRSAQATQHALVVFARPLAPVHNCYAAVSASIHKPIPTIVALVGILAPVEGNAQQGHVDVQQGHPQTAMEPAPTPTMIPTTVGLVGQSAKMDNFVSPESVAPFAKPDKQTATIHVSISPPINKTAGHVACLATPLNRAKMDFACLLSPLSRWSQQAANSNASPAINKGISMSLDTFPAPTHSTPSP
jgi:hypothetical protein